MRRGHILPRFKSEPRRRSEGGQCRLCKYVLLMDYPPWRAHAARSNGTCVLLGMQRTLHPSSPLELMKSTDLFPFPHSLEPWYVASLFTPVIPELMQRIDSWRFLLHPFFKSSTTQYAPHSPTRTPSQQTPAGCTPAGGRPARQSRARQLPLLLLPAFHGHILAHH